MIAIEPKGQLRLFIDPGSNSTGWALFRDKEYLESDTIKTSRPKEHALKRLVDIQYGYYCLASRLCYHSDIEIYFERMNHRVKECIWAVGAIGVTLLDWGAFKWGGEISPLSWQKYVDWKGKRRKLGRYKKRVESEDELSAIGIGLYYLYGRSDESIRGSSMASNRRHKRKRGKVNERKGKKV